MDSMSIPADSAVRSAARDSGVASENPKSPAGSRPLPTAVSASPGSVAKLNLASSIQALKELTSKSNHPAAPPLATSGLTGEPLAVAYEKRIQTLQDTLRERDQVVQMLTQRLEQAADQLDRLHRTGGGRGGSVAVGLPPELIENQQSLLEQLSRVLGDWEEVQATQTLTRIESQITELRELVASGTVSPAKVSATASTPKAIVEEPAKAPPKISAGASVFSDILAADPRGSLIG